MPVLVTEILAELIVGIFLLVSVPIIKKAFKKPVWACKLIRLIKALIVDKFDKKN